MKLSEKILVGLCVGTLIYSAIPGLEGEAAFTTLSHFILGLYYLIGGYWLFNHPIKEQYFLPITIGAAYAASLATLPFTIRLWSDLIFKILPILNLALLAGFMVYKYKGPKTDESKSWINKILVRSFVIALVTSFFAYLPISFKPYRYMLRLVNSNNDYVLNNLDMWEFTERFNEAIEDNNCMLAVKEAEKAVLSGVKWLNLPYIEYEVTTGNKSIAYNYDWNSVSIDDLPLGMYSDDLYWVSGTFSNLYRAYKCVADSLYASRDYEKSLEYQLKAHRALTACDHKSLYWNLEEFRSMNDMAMCYRNLYLYDQADSLFAEAIDGYIDEHEANSEVALTCRNYAKSLQMQEWFEQSNQLYEYSLSILLADSMQEKDRSSDIIKSYFGLIENCLHENDLEKVEPLLSKASEYSSDTNTNVCDIDIYQGLYYYKSSLYLKADSVFTKSLKCYESYLEGNHQTIGENHLALARTKLALADYKAATDHIETGEGITLKNYDVNSARYANYLKVSANIKEDLGDYYTAEREYNKVIDAYIKESGDRNAKLQEAYALLSALEIEIAEYDKAKSHSDLALSIAKDFEKLEHPDALFILNNAAYINYHLGKYSVADSIYKNAIEIGAKHKQVEKVNFANSLNGSALVKTEEKQFEKADSLFKETLKLYLEIFTENHPFTAKVYYNFACLKVKQGKLSEADELLHKAFNVNKAFLDASHDAFADIFMLYGDISSKNGDRNEARNNYQKALDIYTKRFKEGHDRILEARRKLNN